MTILGLLTIECNKCKAAEFTPIILLRTLCELDRFGLIFFTFSHFIRWLTSYFLACTLQIALRPLLHGSAGCSDCCSVKTLSSFH